jgi:hypothetical protein
MRIIKGGLIIYFINRGVQCCFNKTVAVAKCVCCVEGHRQRETMKRVSFFAVSLVARRKGGNHRLITRPKTYIFLTLNIFKYYCSIACCTAKIVWSKVMMDALCRSLSPFHFRRIEMGAYWHPFVKEIVIVVVPGRITLYMVVVVDKVLSLDCS